MPSFYKAFLEDFFSLSLSVSDRCALVGECIGYFDDLLGVDILSSDVTKPVFGIAVTLFE